ncbi:MAG: hypothetical protein WCB34_03885 [Methylovirgula sp.]
MNGVCLQDMAKTSSKRSGAVRSLSCRPTSAARFPRHVVLLKLGDIVPSDAELRESAYLSLAQSALTGESLPVDKKPGDRAYSGSVVRQGQMRGAATATGMEAYFGRATHLAESAERRSHFQRAVLRIGNLLILIAVGLAELILLVALFREYCPLNMLVFVLILTGAAIVIPLPAVLSETMAVRASMLASMKAPSQSWR